jgi:hypothetical protein
VTWLVGGGMIRDHGPFDLKRLLFFVLSFLSLQIQAEQDIKIHLIHNNI